MDTIPSTVDSSATTPVRTFLETLIGTFASLVANITVAVFNLTTRAVVQAGTIALDAVPVQRITYTTNAISTVNPPTTAVDGRRIAVWVINTSGGAMGVITWGTGFKLGGAFTNPANGTRRIIEFECDGTNWYEFNRSAADVTN